MVATAGVTKLHVTGGKTILDQEAWIDLSLAPGWASCQTGSAYTPQYFKTSTNIVHLKGCIRRTGASTGSGLAPDAFYVPAGYRPDAVGNAVGGHLPKEFAGEICVLYYGSTGVFGLSGAGSTFATNERCYITGVNYRADF